MFRNKKTYLVVRVMVTIILLMGCNWLEKGHNEGFWYAGNDSFLDVSAGCTGMFT